MGTQKQIPETTVIFPIETLVRELDIRLVLTSLFAQKHHRILLAHPTHANRLAATLPGGGLYIGKHIMSPTVSNPECYYRAKENGFTVIQLSEEGAVFMGDEKDWRFDLDCELNAGVLSKEDYIATWGDFQREHFLKSSAVNPDHVRVTGHPRFEIYKSNLKNIYQKEAEAIKSRFGDFVLFNSNFSLAVNPMGVKDTFSSWQGYCPEDEEVRFRFIQRWSRHHSAYAESIELIHRLAIQYKELNFVIRPHPSEDIEQIKLAVAGVSNIHVIREGTVAPWILASRVMLSDGCTTAIEAYLMGKPVINFTPVKNEQEAFLPNLLGIRASNQEEALRAVENALHLSWGTKELPERAHRVFANFRQDSMKLFLDLLKEAEAVSLKSSRRITTQLILDQMQAGMVEYAKRFARKVFFEKRYRSSMAMRTLFPGFDRRYMKEKLDFIATMTGRPIKMTYYSPWLVELRRDSI